MPNITVADIKADLTDRLDNMVGRGQITDELRNKLLLSKRMDYAIDTAYSRFALKASPLIIPDLISTATPTVDTSVGTTGVIDDLITAYKWPLGAYSAREDGGILHFIVNDHELGEEHSVSFKSLLNNADSVYYGNASTYFSADYDNSRIYTPKNSTLSIRIISKPQSVAKDSVTELLIDDTYLQEVLAMANQAILEVGFAPTGQAMDEEENQAKEETG